MVSLKFALIAALGGAIGSAARYASQATAIALYGPEFPWGTLFVNVAGCFLMGIVTGLAVNRSLFGPEIRLFLATGILGGFTTFSAFALDSAFLADRNMQSSAAYVAASVIVSIAALYFGLWLAKLGA